MIRARNPHPDPYKEYYSVLGVSLGLKELHGIVCKGATHCIIRERAHGEYFQNSKTLVPIIPVYDLNLAFVGRPTVEIHYKSQLTLGLGHYTLEHDFYIIADKDWPEFYNLDLIFGLDFLESYGMSIGVEKKLGSAFITTLVFNNEHFPLLYHDAIYNGVQWNTTPMLNFHLVHTVQNSNPFHCSIFKPVKM